MNCKESNNRYFFVTSNLESMRKTGLSEEEINDCETETIGRKNIMENHYMMINEACSGFEYSNRTIIAALELEDELYGELYGECRSLVSILYSEIEECDVKWCLPSIYNFKRYDEWSTEDLAIVEDRLKTETYLHYILRGFENEKLIDINCRVRFLIKNKPLSTFFELQDLYFPIFKKLVMYSEHFKKIVISLLAKTLRSINEYEEMCWADAFEGVLFVYGLYIEILEIYDSHKLEVQP